MDLSKLPRAELERLARASLVCEPASRSRLAAACRVVGMQLYDHIVVCDGSYRSMLESGDYLRFA